MAAIKIRISAQLDRSTDAMFGTLEKRSQRAASVIQRNLSAVGKGGPYRSFEREAVRSFNVQEQAAAKAARAAQRENERAARAAGRAWKQLADVGAREAARAIRQQGRELDRFARRTSHRTTRFLTPNAPIGSAAARATRDLANGVGVDFNLSGSVQRAVDLQRSAVELSNQSAISGNRAPASELIGLSRGIGEKLALDPSQIMGGLRAFTAKTGDVESAKQLLEPLARLSVATGSNFADMGDAAGFVAMQLGDIPDKAARVVDVIRSMAAQGAIGSVEMKDLAVEMGRISAASGKFEGNQGENIKKLGALAQLSLARGGATSAADAARSVASFGNTFGKGARMKAFKKEGVDLYNKGGQLRDPFEIIKDSFRKTGGDIPKLSNMFADTLGRKPVEALGTVFRQAGGGEAGIAAIDKELKKFASATLDAQTETQNVEQHMTSLAARAQKFQNQLDRIVGVLADRVLPELERSGPAILKATQTFANIGAWAVENPSKAIGAAIAVAITRASVESALRAGIERVLVGTLGGSAGGKPGGSTAMNMIGGAGSAIAIASLAVATFTVGTAIIDSWFAKDENQQRKDALSDAELGGTLGAAKAQARSGAVSPEVRDRLQKDQSELRSKIQRADELAKQRTRSELNGAASPQDAAGSAILRSITELFSSEADKRLESEQMRKDMQEVQSLLDQIKSGVLKVQVTNPQPAAAPITFGAGDFTPSGRSKNGIP